MHLFTALKMFNADTTKLPPDLIRVTGKWAIAPTKRPRVYVLGSPSAQRVSLQPTALALAPRGLGKPTCQRWLDCRVRKALL